MEIKLIIDIIFSMGILGFIIASFKQFLKIYRTKETAGLSVKKYYIKFYSISCMITAYILSGAYISLCSSLLELSICISSVYLVTKYRWGGFDWRRILK